MSEPIDTAAMLADAEQVEAETRAVNTARAAVGVGACGGIVEQSIRLAAHVKALVAENERLADDLQRILATTAHVKMGTTPAEVCDKVILAADEIVTLRERVAALEAAAIPFAALVDGCEKYSDSEPRWDDDGPTVGECRQLAALLAPEGGK